MLKIKNNYMKFKLLLLCISIALFSCNQEKTQIPEQSINRLLTEIGTTYYVSATGSDSNNGKSESAAWKTITKVESVCNAGTILPGDKILFKRGDSFTGKVIIGSIWGKKAKSGTAASPITFSAYGTGAKPQFLYPTGGTTNVTNRITMTIVGVDYYIFDNLNFTDLDKTNNKITPANCGMALYLGAEGEGPTNNCTVQNVDVSFCGMGIVLIGNSNKVTGCNLTDFKNLKSTNGGDDDYGANALTIISGNDNEIVNNYIAGAWAASLDYGWNGGACEIFNSCHRNKLMYNTFVDCGGVSEFGAYEKNASANDNLIAYNKIINCGGLSWCNISGNFAIQVSNLQYYNNVVIENSESRFSGINTGVGLTPQYQALIGPETLLFAYNGSPSAASVFNLKNNVFILSTGLSMTRTNDAKTAHSYNLYSVSGGSKVTYTLGTGEKSLTSPVFTSQSGSVSTWSYILNQPLQGTYVGITKDFNGNVVSADSTSIGLFQSSVIITPPTCVPLEEKRTMPCMVNQTGTITQVRKFTCPEGIWTDWVTIATTCVDAPLPTTFLTNDASYIYLNAPKQGTYRMYKGIRQVKYGSYPKGVSKIDIRSLNSGTYSFRTNNKKYNVIK